MAENQNMQDKVNNWLLDEGLTVSKKDDNTADFHLVVSNAYGLGFFIDIVKPKNKLFLVIAMGIPIPPEIKQPYVSLDQKEKTRFIGGLQRELLKFGVEHRIQPDKLQPDGIVITDSVYDEDMTRTLFMTSVRKVKYASLFVVWSLSQKFLPEADSSPSNTPSPSNVPYR